MFWDIRVPRYKTKQNKTISCQGPSSSIIVGPVVWLNAVSKGCFAGCWLSNPSSVFTAGLNWANLAYHFHSAMNQWMTKIFLEQPRLHRVCWISSQWRYCLKTYIFTRGPTAPKVFFGKIVVTFELIMPFWWPARFIILKIIPTCPILRKERKKNSDCLSVIDDYKQTYIHTYWHRGY